MHHILIIKTPNSEAKIITLGDSYFTIGRSSANSLAIKSHLISRFHATILPLKRFNLESTSYWVMDGNLEQGGRSTNGVMVNNRSILMYELQPEDRITLPSNLEITYRIIDQAQEGESTTFLQLNPEQIIDNIGQKPTFPTLNYSLASLEKPTLIRLASFSELSPFVIVEINTKLEITYINPSGREIFPNLGEDLSHPLLQNMIKLWFNQQASSDIAQFIYKRNTFEQFIYKNKEYQVIRSYIVNITSRKQAEIILEYTANHDELTGLFNRRFFIKRLSDLLQERQANQDSNLAILFIDLDRFKNINDTFGHDLGDLLLQSFALRLQQSLRSNDVIARWGGDEFIIIIDNFESRDNLNQIARNIFNNLQSPFNINGQNFRVRASIGISVYPDNGTDQESLIKHADAALYRSKEEGRDQHKFYTSTMTSKASAYLSLENLLHQALENQEFILYYQPQIKLATNKVCGMEALIRWQQPELGLINPADFIPLAEDTGLIIQIGQWVLQQACQQTKVWHDQGFGELKISVNINYRQLSHSDFNQVITQVLEDTNLDPHYLELEVTETTLIKDIDLVDQIIHDLQAKGISLALDDFGTGYSSLSYLNRIPFNTIKIDRSFTNNILAQNSRELAIISAIIILGQTLNLKIVIEGLETQDQLNVLLTNWNNHQSLYIQGYFYSRPLNPRKATEFLIQSRDS